MQAVRNPPKIGKMPDQSNIIPRIRTILETDQIVVSVVVLTPSERQLKRYQAQLLRRWNKITELLIIWQKTEMRVFNLLELEVIAQVVK